MTRVDLRSLRESVSGHSSLKSHCPSCLSFKYSPTRTMVALVPLVPLVVPVLVALCFSGVPSSLQSIELEEKGE
ncbi:hypothetical protein RRG08_037643 [Elysia crispata]|uniref:Uncharacterized protein n=1 Tax=Elysia crispata TaxID=231223 RepID=A0AAE0YGY9_9GAST|nr:hypothetical protein RRG08_037643 [Elysia crispata]